MRMKSAIKQGKAVEAQMVSNNGGIDTVWLRFQCCSIMKAFLRSKINRQFAMGFNICPFCTKPVKSNDNEARG